MTYKANAVWTRPFPAIEGKFFGTAPRAHSRRSPRSGRRWRLGVSPCENDPTRTRLSRAHAVLRVMINSTWFEADDLRAHVAWHFQEGLSLHSATQTYTLCYDVVILFGKIYPG